MQNKIFIDNYNFLTTKTNLDLRKTTEFVEEISKTLKNKLELSGIYSPTSKEGYQIPYNPIDYFNLYNIFSYHNDQMYDLLQYIKTLTQEMCNKLNIDYNTKKYHIHGWINRYLGELNLVKKNDLPWHNHGHERDHFHGVIAINAEPSVTHYRIDGKDLDFVHENGQMVLLTNYEHSHGYWQGKNPRITLAFNVKPINELPDISEEIAPYIPL